MTIRVVNLQYTWRDASMGLGYASPGDASFRTQ